MGRRAGRHPESGTDGEPREDNPIIGRRALLGGAALAAAAAGAQVVGAAPADATDTTPLLVGQTNTATLPTILQDSGAGFSAFTVTGPGMAVVGGVTGSTGIGVAGAAPNISFDPNEPQPNAGVYGLAVAGDPGVLGKALNGAGVSGVSTAGSGVHGQSTSQWGVLGDITGDAGAGVAGLAPHAAFDPNDPKPNAGVYGLSELNHPAVFGQALIGPGLLGVSTSGPGAVAQSFNAPGLQAQSNKAAGVQAQSTFGPGVWGDSAQDPGVVGTMGGFALDPNDPNPTGGVYGFAANAVGVFGFSKNSIGVLGESKKSIGLRGISMTATAAGVEARNTASGGIGLSVVGRAVFTTRGSSSVSTNQSQKTVLNGNVRTTSVVLITFTSSPSTRVLRWVHLSPGSGFTVYLTGAVPATTTFNYLILN